MPAAPNCTETRERLAAPSGALGATVVGVRREARSYGDSSSNEGPKGLADSSQECMQCPPSLPTCAGGRSSPIYLSSGWLRYSGMSSTPGTACSATPMPSEATFSGTSLFESAGNGWESCCNEGLWEPARCVRQTARLQPADCVELWDRAPAHRRGRHQKHDQQHRGQRVITEARCSPSSSRFVYVYVYSDVDYVMIYIDSLSADRG